MFSCHLTKGHNFCDFLFVCLLGEKTLLDGPTFKERIAHSFKSCPPFKEESK